MGQDVQKLGIDNQKRQYENFLPGSRKLVTRSKTSPVIALMVNDTFYSPSSASALI